MVHPDQGLLPCSCILHYYTWEYGHISIMSRFLKALYHPCLTALAVKQNSIIIYCPPTWVRWFSFTGKKPVQETSEIYWSHHWAVQYCYTAKEEEKNCTWEARLMSQMTLKEILVTCSGREESWFFLAGVPHPLAWTKQYRFTGSVLSSSSVNVDGFVSSLLLVLAQRHCHQTALTQGEALARAEGVPVLWSLILVDWCPLLPRLYSEETPWSLLRVSWGALAYCPLLQIV